MAISLTKQTIRKIDELNAAINAARSSGVRVHPRTLSAGIGPEGAKDVKRLGRDILADVLNANSLGTPEGPIEAAAVKAIRADSDNVRNRIAALVAKGEPAPEDYYDILNKVLVDSGSTIHTDAKVVRGALAAVRASGSCGACSACNACAACGGCAASVVEGLVVAGVAGLAASHFV
jgi:hypothetical protein